MTTHHTNALAKRILANSDIKDKFWNEYLSGIGNSTKAAWYHSAGLDWRPLKAIRSLTNWHYLSGRDNRELHAIGTEIRGTMMLFSDFHPRIYRELLEIWMAKRDKDESKFNQVAKHLLRTPHLFSWNLLLSIEPFRVYTEEERNHSTGKMLRLNPHAEARKGHSHNGHHGTRRIQRSTDWVVSEDHEYDGFLIKLAGYDGSQALFDTVIYFCLDDRDVMDLLRETKVKVACLFENRAHGDNGDGIGTSFEHIFETPEDAESLKYLFTDNYDYCDSQGKLKLNEESFRLLHESAHKYEVDYVIRGVNIKPVVQPSPRDVLGHGGGFCLAIRR
jgi:hypothetical protein